jgi:ADP-ribosylglycohydrolase
MEPSPVDRHADVIGAYLQHTRSEPLSWPFEAQSQDPDLLRDLYSGALLWGAVGDALGRAVEGRSPTAIREEFGDEGLVDYVPWSGWTSGPRGTITDDTQLTIEVARNLLASEGLIDPLTLAAQFVEWLPHGRGVGRATRAAVVHLRDGAPWWQAGPMVDSAGNGAAMRAAPVGLVHAFGPSPARLARDAVLASVITHSHAVGVAGAIALAAAVAWCIRTRVQMPGSNTKADRNGLLSFVANVLTGVEPEPTQERRPGAGAVRLVDRISELNQLVLLEPSAAFERMYNGAFALESVPAALYCFLRHSDEPERVILTAVNAGYDADSVGSMAGNLVGAWCGADLLQGTKPEWWRELELRDELVDIGRRLALQARVLAGPKGGYDGEFTYLSCPAIPNESLVPADVPEARADWLDVWRFALSTDGYSRWGNWCSVIANEYAQRYEVTRGTPRSLELLRVCLFFEQRRYRHMDQTPTGSGARYVRRLVSAIREVVSAGNPL